MTKGPAGVMTSASHPLWIDVVGAGDAGGQIGITFCPGKHDDSLYGGRWERDLDVDLDVIARWQPSAMVTLIEDHEFSLLHVPLLGEGVRARNIEWHHLPIVDVEPPDARFESRWRTSGPKLLGYLRAGGRVLVHCRGGLGRAGTVAARLLIELDAPNKEAVALVRKARPGAIQTSEQERYLLNLPRPMSNR